MTFDFEAVVIGAGAVGLACGYALARRGLEIAVLESAPAIATRLLRNADMAVTEIRCDHPSPAVGDLTRLPVDKTAFRPRELLRES